MASRFCWVPSAAVRSVEDSCGRLEAAIEGGATARIDRTWRLLRSAPSLPIRSPKMIPPSRDIINGRATRLQQPAHSEQREHSLEDRRETDQHNSRTNLSMTQNKSAPTTT